MDLTATDWEFLEQLATRIRYPVERIGALRRRLDATLVRPGAPYTLVAGRPSAGIELLLARWISADANDELQKVGDRPLVIGPSPTEVRPKLGTWPTWKWKPYDNGHLIFLRSGGKVPSDILAQLASLGSIDQLVLVVRMGQAMHTHETELAQSVSSICAAARALLIALPSEEPTAADLAEVSASSATKLRQVGYTESRCLGAGVWFTGGEFRPGTVEDVGRFLRIGSAEADAGRKGMARTAVVGLLADVQRHAEKTPEATQLPVTPDECERLTRELGNHLSDLGKEIERQGQLRAGLNSEFIRTYALDALRSWGAFTSIEGHWLKYVERLRPGTQNAFLDEVKNAVGVLDFEPGKEPLVPVESSSPTMRSETFFEWLTVQAKRLGIAIFCGLTAYFLSWKYLTPENTGFPPLFIDILNWLALGLAVILGFGAGRFIFRSRPLIIGAATAPPQERVPASVHGWLQLERRMTAWFSERIRNPPTSPVDECRKLAERLGIQEEVRA